MEVLMAAVSRSFKLRLSSLALCLTMASGVFVVLESASPPAGAAFTCTVAVCPTISAISNHFTPTTGGTPITITGTGFQSGATVVVGQGQGPTSTAIPMTSVVVVSSTQITAVTGATSASGTDAQAGVWGVFVVNPDGGYNPSAFQTLEIYNPLPTISNITPRSGPVAGGTAITIQGASFQTKPGTTVFIAQGNGLTGAIQMTNVVVVSSSQITAVTGGGAKAGTFSVIVVNPDGGVSKGSVASLFKYM
jgi:hypothetical protein